MDLLCLLLPTLPKKSLTSLLVHYVVCSCLKKEADGSPLCVGIKLGKLRVNNRLWEAKIASER